MPRHVFTRAECRKGYRTAVKRAIAKGWDAHAWLFRKVRKFYSAKKKIGKKAG